MEPSEIYLIGIQPEDISMGTDLTDLIEQKAEKMIEITMKQLSEWGITFSEISMEKKSGGKWNEGI
jgi:Ni,Fe-hydrogenase maturation factor